MIILDNFEFYIKNNELAISIDCSVAEINNLRWDTRNTIILTMENGEQYLLTNILPNIRDILQRIETVMIVFKQKQEIVEAYDVEIIKDNTLEFDDLFNEEAISCYRKFEILKKNSDTTF